MFNPKVAIIVPIFNVEKFLTPCLESCQKQSYKNIEVIMIDDGSSDSCFDIALDFVRRDSRFVLIKKPNGGQGSARNVGLDYLFNELELCDLDSKNYNILDKKLGNIESNLQDSIKMQKGFYTYRGSVC
ncbi:glycosyltransferase family 2 protein [Helicobacter saguini]|uniref:Glycosyltransferase n=1 Tax=Helicobacter saguini TaxID=1548018 RepID=A0A6L7D9I0_9HELI|nr:glycosyltransferase family A protein [Helicobacter saguini]MWV68553.1 glycosyltransferase [Helicobacter saguini]